MMNLCGKQRAIFSAVALILAGFAGVAHAACVGGKKLNGNFGVTINGPVVGGNTSEVYNGILTADGKCGLSGSLTGGAFGQQSITRNVTGSYSFPKAGEGAVTLQLPNSSTAVVFDVGLVKDGAFSEVTGVASNGPAVATVDFVEIAKQSYGVGSLSGAYIANCTGAGNDGSGGFGNELAYVTFDGAGNLTVLTMGNNNGHSFSASLSGTYSVGENGEFFVQDSAPYTQFTASGEIVAGSEVRDVLLQSTSGYGPYRSCVVKKQA